MSVSRIAIIYDDRARPETTGVHCFKALQSLVQVAHVLPDDADRLKPADYDLFIRIDDGFDRPLPAGLRPLAWWAIDTHLDFERCHRTAAVADWTFAAQRPGAEMLGRHGIEDAEWLPLACDPDLHRPHGGAKLFDFCFVGNVLPGPRANLLELLQLRFPRHFVGNAYFEALARVHSESRTAFNRSIGDDLNMRVFESLACGSLLLTNELPAGSGMRDLFQDGCHLATYGSAEELIEKLNFHLSHDSIRTEVENAGHAEVTAKHTYRHRMERILERAASRPRTVPVAPGSVVALDYFEFERPELLALVPLDARDIVDVGCGAGRLGAAIKIRQEAKVTGIEMDSAAAAAARTRLDLVVEGDLERIEWPFQPLSIDAAVCGDVLEHLRDPLALLRKIHSWLRPGGTLVVSLPNVRHHSVVRGLLEGNWTYEAAGLLDHTHLKFFTKREIEKLLSRAGFTHGPLHAVPGPGHAEWVAAGRPNEVRVGGLNIQSVARSEAEEFYTYQWIGSLQSLPSAAPGLTSIIVITFNQLLYTRQCLASLRLLTDEPFELIVIDNGSTDGTPEYLSALAAADSRVRVVFNHENKGFPTAANQGLKLGRGGQFLLLNNDTILTTGWLKHLLSAMGTDESWGLLGPVSNRVSGEQQIHVTYRDLEALDGFAWEWGKAEAGAVIETERIVGFCMLIRRSVYERVGDFDESFGIGNFEDDDYCLRVRRAGFRCGIVRSSFVHHFGSVTFRNAGIDHAKLLSENEAKYLRKWHRSAELSPWTVNAHPDGGLLLKKRVRVSGCLIVRDNSRTIRACLASLKPWMDELVVVDTGSKDETPKIAQELGARVFHFPWCDDFSAARNESIRHASGEWVFWMDSDDTIDERTGQSLRSLVDGPHSDEILGYVVRVHCPEPGNGDVVVVDHVKLFRNQSGLRFEGRIHEQILPAIRNAGGTVAWTDLHVTHSGYDHSPEGQARKRERDLRLLALELLERPDHPFTLFNLGMTHSDLGNHECAIGFLDKCLEHSAPGDSHRRKAHALLVHSNLQSGRTAEAMSACERGLDECPDDLELRFRHGSLLHLMGKHHEAIETYRRLLADSGPRYFTSVDQGLKGYKAHQNLAAIYVDMGHWEQAEAEWRAVVADAPDHAPGWRGLGECLLRQRKWSEAGKVVEQLAATDREYESLLLDGQLALTRGEPDRARRIWQRAAAMERSDAEALQLLARVHFEAGEDPSAVGALREIIRRDPHDPAAYHNLGSVLLRGGDAGGAMSALSESVRLRPDSLDTWIVLGHAFHRCGDYDQATMAWRAALELDPQNQEAQESLRSCRKEKFSV